MRTAIKPLRRRKHTVFISELASEFATKTFRIDVSGDVTLPFAGRIRAAGLTADGLAQQVNAHLMKIINEPEAVVGIAEFHSQSVSVLERDTLTLPAMPFALMIREGSWEVLHARFPELREAPTLPRYGQRVRFLPPIAAPLANAAARPVAIVFPQFLPDADGASEINPLDTLQTLLRLQESGFWVAHDEQSIRAFLQWLQTTASFSMSYSDVDQAAAMVSRLVA